MVKVNKEKAILYLTTQSPLYKHALFFHYQNLDEWQSLKLFGSYLENEFRGSKQQLLVSIDTLQYTPGSVVVLQGQCVHHCMCLYSFTLLSVQGISCSLPFLGSPTSLPLFCFFIVLFIFYPVASPLFFQFIIYSFHSFIL